MWWSSVSWKEILNPVLHGESMANRWMVNIYDSCLKLLNNYPLTIDNSDYIVPTDFRNGDFDRWDYNLITKVVIITFLITCQALYDVTMFVNDNFN